MKYARILGFALIGVLIFAAIFVWRDSVAKVDSASAAELLPNLEGIANAPVQIIEAELAN